jgi:hypothetical protein
MGDLFGEDSNVDFVHHSRLVFHQARAPVLVPFHASFKPNSDYHLASGAPSAAESRFSSPSSAPPPDDGLSSPDRKRRQALEYEEDEEPNPLIEHRLEASVSIPNVPLPKSSDGQVRISEDTGTRFHLISCPYHSIGLSGCPILSKWTLNISIRTLTLGQNMRRTSWAALTNATWVSNSV